MLRKYFTFLGYVQNSRHIINFLSTTVNDHTDPVALLGLYSMEDTSLSCHD